MLDAVVKNTGHKVFRFVGNWMCKLLGIYNSSSLRNDVFTLFLTPLQGQHVRNSTVFCMFYLFYEANLHFYTGWCTYPSDKYQFVNWDYDIPNIWIIFHIWKIKKAMFQTTKRYMSWRINGCHFFHDTPATRFEFASGSFLALRS